ncbi:MAG: MYXO-CTERM sorting domain-containing protein [Kofleriaceae bacterium]
MKKIRVDSFVLTVAALIAFGGCGGGCDSCGMQPIPGGFPSAKRTGEAVQVRITPTGLGKITADPAGVIGPLLGSANNGVIQVPFPPGGPIEVDLGLRAGDLPRLVLTPQQDAKQLQVIIRARVRTITPLQVDVAGSNCTVTLNTMPGSNQDLRIQTNINFTQDPTTGTTRIAASGTQITQLDSADFSLGGDILCIIGNILPPSTLQDQLEGPIEDAINDATCKACDSGQVSECGQGATACTDNVCRVSDRCMQETGLVGRLVGGAVLAGLSPGTTGAFDLYEVLGGYAYTDDGGISLGMLGGMQPAGADRDRCGPRGVEPAMINIDELPLFKGNVRTDVTPNQPFDVGIGLHKNQLDQFAYAAYDGGFLCLTIGNGTVEQLTTDTLSLLSRSLGDLVDGNSPMAIGLRPQQQPTIILGRNTFMPDGNGGQTLVEPLLDITFPAMEIDFFASIDDQYVRVFTLVSDLHLPIGLLPAMGELTPVIGAVEDAFTNVSVKNSEAVTETPESLANTFPQILGLVLPQLSGGLGSIALPELGGLQLAVTAVTSVDNNNFMAIFANLVTTPAAPVHTEVTMTGVSEPATEVAKNPRMWKHNQGPAVSLYLGDSQNLEWSFRTDRGFWSPWSTNRHPTIAPTTFWLPGKHTIEVRAREIGKPETIDTTPELIEVELGTDVPMRTSQRPGPAPFHGSAGASGCSCETSGGGAGTGLFALMLGALVFPLRRSRRGRRAARAVLRSIKRTSLIVWIAAIAMLPGCSCGDAPCGDQDCLPGEVANGGIGRYTSIVGDDERVLVATYDTGLGDLVVVDATDPSALELVAVDGIPDITPIHDPSTYRGGVSAEEAGPNVGTWTAIALTSDHLGRVSYHDRDEGALRYAFETKKGKWTSYAVDVSDNGEIVGTHTSIVVDSNKHPVIAYIATGVDDGQGNRNTELRVARSLVVTPEDASDWSISLVAQAPGSCAGLCGSGSACIADDTGLEMCIAEASNCPSSCDPGDACIAGSCTAEVGAPTTAVLAKGTGLFPSLVVLSDGRIALTYYDRLARSLKIAVENAADTGNFTESVLDETLSRDNGMWSSAIVDGAGTVHVAYQDAIGDQLMYTTWNGAAGTPEVVDDGRRQGDRTHTVGASAAIYLVNGTPAIAYHDGLSSDVYVASRQNPWSVTNVAPGPLLDGISVDGTTGPGGGVYLAWDSIDKNASPIHNLVVKRQ